MLLHEKRIYPLECETGQIVGSLLRLKGPALHYKHNLFNRIYNVLVESTS